MADNKQFNNLQDMIAFIEDPNLQVGFFKLHAKDIVIDWGKLPLKPYPRAEAIYKALEAQRAQHEDQFDKVFTELRTIAFVNAESDNWSTLQSIIEGHKHLAEFIQNSLTTPFDPQSANLAVYITLVANRTVDNASNEVIAEANETWKEIIAKASADIRQAGISPATAFEPSPLSIDEREDNLKDFEDTLRLHLLDKFAKKNFYVAVHTIRTKEYTHYVVTTSPLPHSVVAINDANDDTYTKKDDQAKSFEIIVDEYHNRIHSTKTVLIGYATLAECFISKMLRSKPKKLERLYYAKGLQVFKDKGILKKLTLPKEASDQGAKVWIEELDVRLKDERLPTTFRGSELQDIYTEIEQQIDLKRFPFEGWGIVGAKLKVHLPGVVNGDNSLVFAQFAPGDKDYTIAIGEQSFSVPGKNKTFNRKHLEILEALQDRWGIKGLKRSQLSLGVKGKQVQGELLP